VTVTLERMNETINTFFPVVSYYKFENRSIFDEVEAYEVKAYKSVPVFWGHPIGYISLCHIDY